MLRSASSVTNPLMLLLVVGIQGCTLQEGQPWGQADLSLFAGFAPEQDRLDSEGGLLTSSDYVIDIDDLRVGLSELRLVLASESGGTTTFDPANPPAGYSLCHGGHCHSDDGRLVDYEDIAAELAGGGGAGGFTLVRAIDAAVPLTTELPSADGAVSLGACAPDASCGLPIGSLLRVEVSIQSIALQGTVRDRRVPPRFTNVDVAFDVGVDVTLQTAVAGEVGPGDPMGVRVITDLAITEKLLDGVDFAAIQFEGLQVDGVLELSASATLARILAEHASDSTLSTRVERFTPPPAAFVWENP